MINPDSLENETDSIEVIIIFGNDTVLIYSGARGSDGFDGPYIGILENYSNESIILQIVQYDSNGVVISSISYEYDEPDKHSILTNADTIVIVDINSVRTEIRSKLVIVNDTTSSFGTLWYFLFNGSSLDSVHVYNGDTTGWKEKNPSVVIKYEYGDFGKTRSLMIPQSGPEVDSTFAYDQAGNLVKLMVVIDGSKEYDTLIWNNDGHLESTAHYSSDSLTRIVKHKVSSSSGVVTADSVFAVEGSEHLLLRVIEYAYEDDSLKTKSIYENRGGVSLSRSEEYIYNDDKLLIRIDKYEEGGNRLLIESMSFTYTEKKNVETIIIVDEVEQELIQYYRYTYKIPEKIPEDALLKASGNQSISTKFSLSSLLSRMADWELPGKNALQDKIQN